MATYMVVVEADAREVYYVDADSEADAMANWHTGVFDHTSSSSGEPVSAELVDED